MGGKEEIKGKNEGIQRCFVRKTKEKPEFF